jgi:NDP-sugar pyrophosphorylase family protein
LEIWLEKLDECELDQILVNAHHLADQVIKFVHSREWKSEVLAIHETCLKGTAGSVKEISHMFGASDALIVHADNYFRGDIQPLLNAFLGRPMEIEICMYTFECSDPSQVGVVETDQSGIVTMFWEKSPLALSRHANAAIFAVSQSVIEAITTEVDFSAEVLPKYLGRTLAIPLEGQLLDVGTPINLERAIKIETKQQKGHS